MSEQMKPTGIVWIGDVPESWCVKKIKYFATLKGRIGWQGLTSDEYTDEGPYLITGVDFENGKVNWDNCVHISKDRWTEATEIQIQNGDLLITKDGTVGKVAIVTGLNGLASLNSGVLLVRTNTNFNRKFLFWVLQSEEFWAWFRLKNAGNSTIIHLYQNDFAEFCYTYPKIEEQTFIADFLDKQCAKIDGIASDIEKQIELLQKYKKSLITETVTKGLDKSAPMKDSNIERIGKIPQYWKAKRLKFISKLKTGTTPAANEGINYEFDGFNWFTPADFNHDMSLNISKRFINENAIKYENITVYPANSVLLVAVGATVGKIGYTIEKAYSNQQITAIIPSGICGKYLLYYIASKSDYIKANALYTTLPIINNSYLGSIYTVIPSEVEQIQIADYLDKQCKKIDFIIESKKQQQLKIKQHKKSLIYEYVTGKKRVKGAINNGN